MKTWIAPALLALSLLAGAAHRAFPADLQEWTIAVDIQIDAGEPDTLYRQQHFPSEQVCEAFLNSGDFIDEISRLLNAVAANSPHSNIVGFSNGRCVKVPPDGEPA